MRYTYPGFGSSSDYLANRDKIQTPEETSEEILQEILRDFPSKSKNGKSNSTPRNREGYVYLLHAPHDPMLFKIGRASNPDNRLRTFNVKLPFPVEYICVIKTVDMYKLEKELHSMFELKRLDGEWFKLTEYEVEFIKGLATS